jgi:hypothetical protein
MRAHNALTLALILLAGCSDSSSPGTDAGDEDDGTPSVSFLEPGPGAMVENPVTFRIGARHVDEVEVFADDSYSLGAAWDPAVRDDLRYRFAQTGAPRQLHVVGRVAGVEVARADLSLTVAPDSCEERFFVHEFDKRNTDPTGTIDLFSLREESLAAIEHEVETLQACGAGLTLGNMMSLLLYEGGFRVAAFNTRCSENSYNRTTSNCDVVAEALYSYQFGIGGIHTSNFHPCKGGAYTQGMRQRFLAAAMEAGFPVDASLVTPALATRFATVCPTKTPTAVDYYLLGAHDVFAIPKNTSGNDLAAHATFPLFSPKASVSLTFGELAGACSTITNDRDAIRRFGGGDTSYGQTAKQDEIMSYYKNYKAANCP